MDRVTAELEEIYKQLFPEEDPIPVMLQLVLVMYGPHSEEEITSAVQSIHTGRVGGLSEIRAENLNMWLIAHQIGPYGEHW